MARTRNFVDWQVFKDIMEEVRRVDGTEYQDVPTVYGDMSRLVVAWLASQSPEELGKLYERLGWGGPIRTARQMHLAARRWLERYHPGRF